MKNLMNVLRYFMLYQFSVDSRFTFQDFEKYLILIKTKKSSKALCHIQTRLLTSGCKVTNDVHNHNSFSGELGYPAKVAWDVTTAKQIGTPGCLPNDANSVNVLYRLAKGWMIFY